jgi:small subunit ribosomal protein S16
MAVKIRLKRMGKKKQPTYRVVVADGRSPRDGRFIEAIGRYDPRQEPSIVEIDNDKAIDWLQKGAQPTDPVRKLLEISGAWSRFKVARGEIHTVAAKPVPVAAQAAPETVKPAPAIPEALETELPAQETPKAPTEPEPEPVSEAAEVVEPVATETEEPSA